MPIQKPENWLSFDVTPKVLNRAVSPADLDQTEARILQGADVVWMKNWLRRSAGYARTQVTGASSSVLNAFYYTRADCSGGVLDFTNGTVRNTCSDRSAACTAVLPLWNDSANSGNSQNIDAGVASNWEY